MKGKAGEQLITLRQLALRHPLWDYIRVNVKYSPKTRSCHNAGPPASPVNAERAAQISTRDYNHPRTSTFYNPQAVLDIHMATLIELLYLHWTSWLCTALQTVWSKKEERGWSCNSQVCKTSHYNCTFLQIKTRFQMNFLQTLGFHCFFQYTIKNFIWWDAETSTPFNDMGRLGFSLYVPRKWLMGQRRTFTLHRFIAAADLEVLDGTT